MAKVKLTTSEAIQQLRILIQELNNLKTTSNKVGVGSANSLKRIENQLTEIKSANIKLNTTLQFVDRSLRKNTTSINTNSKAHTTNSKSLEYQLKLGNVYNKQISENTKRVDKNTKSTKKANSGLKNLWRSTKALIGAFGVLSGVRLFASIVKNVFKLTKEFDSLNFTLKAITDTNFDLASSQRFLLGISEAYGVELLQTSKRYVKFLAAAKQSNISLADTEKIFGSVTKAASLLGLKTDELTGVYLALEQMLSKGKVTTEELRRQLGERIPGAMGIMASALDVTIPKLDEMLKKGEVLSADALPKFADAIELAFGVSQVQKIDNLVTAQNRLSNTWQIWVKDLSEGDGALNKVFKDALDFVNEIIKKLASITASPALILQQRIISEETEYKSVLDKQARDIYEKRIGDLVDFEKEKSRLFQISLTEYNNFNDKEKDAHDQKLADILGLEKKQQDEIIKFKKEIAKGSIEETTRQYLVSQNLYDDELKLRKKYQLDLDRLKEKQKEGVNFAEYFIDADKRDAREVIEKKIKDLEEGSIDRLSRTLALRTAIFDTQRKLLQVSEKTVAPNAGGSGDSKKIDTSDLDLEILQLQNRIKNFDSVIADPKTSFYKRVTILKEVFQLQNELADKQYEKELRLAEENENEGLISEEKSNQKRIDIQKKYADRKGKITQDYFTQRLTEIGKNSQAELNKELIVLREKYALIKNATKKEEKEYLDAVAEAKRKSQNSQILLETEFIQTILDTVEIYGDERIELERLILEKLAKLREGSVDSDSDSEEAKWVKILKYAKEFLSEVDGLVDAVFNRKIENIEAEIKAEEDKYDQLIKLAEGNDLEQKNLEEEKEARTKELEKKRLKEQQKQAKAQKVFALAEIAINTAVAISKVLGQTGIFGLAAWIPVAALGALQTATVLAQPIPQYKHGSPGIKKEHVGMINDGGQQEYIERNGQILTTDTKNAIVNLLPDDIIYRNYDQMASKSKILGNVTKGNNTSQTNFNGLFLNITKSIDKGFKKAKINNSINNIIPERDNYKEKMSRWN